MENDHTISALLRKRAEIAGKIEHHQTMLRQSIIDLDNLDATIRLFVPDADLEEIKPKPFPPRNTAFRGEVARLVLGALRQSPEPMTTQQLAQHFMAERGLNAADKRLVKTIGKRIGACLRHHRNTGVLRSRPGPGQYQVWEISRE